MSDHLTEQWKTPEETVFGTPELRLYRTAAPIGHPWKAGLSLRLEARRPVTDREWRTLLESLGEFVRRSRQLPTGNPIPPGEILEE